jgi:hypothetical protein
MSSFFKGWGSKPSTPAAASAAGKGSEAKAAAQPPPVTKTLSSELSESSGTASGTATNTRHMSASVLSHPSPGHHKKAQKSVGEASNTLKSILENAGKKSLFDDDEYENSPEEKKSALSTFNSGVGLPDSLKGSGNVGLTTSTPSGKSHSPSNSGTFFPASEAKVPTNSAYQIDTTTSSNLSAVDLIKTSQLERYRAFLSRFRIPENGFGQVSLE